MRGIEYDLVYLERNSEGDKEKAYSLLDQALAMYQKMEAREKIENLAARKEATHSLTLIETHFIHSIH